MSKSGSKYVFAMVYLDDIAWYMPRHAIAPSNFFNAARAALGTTGAQGPGEGAIDQPTGQPTPEKAQCHGLMGAVHRNEGAGDGGDVLPHADADTFQLIEDFPPAADVESQQNHHDAGEHSQVRRAMAGDLVIKRGASQSNGGAGGGVRADSAHAEQQLIAELLFEGTGLSGDNRGGERAADAAAHSDTV